MSAEEFDGYRDGLGRATFVFGADRIVQFAWSAPSPEEQPDLQTFLEATNWPDDQCAIEEPDASA